MSQTAAVEPKPQDPMTDTPSKEAIKQDLRRRIEDIDSRLQEFDALRQEREDLSAALSALEGDLPKSPGRDRKGVKRGTREEVDARRNQVERLAKEQPNLSTKEIASQLGVGYQTAANDIRLLKSSGRLPN